MRRRVSCLIGALEIIADDEDEISEFAAQIHHPHTLVYNRKTHIYLITYPT